MRLVIDMDEVIVNFMGPLLKKYNKLYGRDLVFEDITSWGLPDEMANIFLYDDPHFFTELPPLPGAIEGMRYLKDVGHDIIIATSPSKVPSIASQKMTWMQIWLPEFVDHLHMVHRKDRLIGDFLCDDNPTFLMEFAGPFRAIMDKPWNRNMVTSDRCCRVYGWDDLIRAVLNYFTSLSYQRPGPRTAYRAGGR